MKGSKPDGLRKVSVVITTKNRKDELRMAIRSALDQNAFPEVLVLDDGSSDGTARMVKEEFPGVVFHGFQESRGYIVRRNQGALLAKGEIIISIDDDAAFSSPQVVEQTLAEFSDSRIGAVAIPYFEPYKENRVMQQAPNREQVWITDRFIGTAHGLRRDIFVMLGGYREHLVHQGEESDFCLRLRAAGYVVRLGRADPIHHFESPKRDHRRLDYYGARNAILFVWQNVPWPAFPLYLFGTTVNVLRWTCRPARFFFRLRAVLAGYHWCMRHWNSRQPVSRAAYDLHRSLKSSSASRLSEIKPKLPPMKGN